MNTKSIIKSLNLKAGEVLTLEKAKDRLEFEALPLFNAGADKCLFLNTVCDTNSPCGTKCGTNNPDPCRDTQPTCSSDRPDCPSKNVG